VRVLTLDAAEGVNIEPESLVGYQQKTDVRSGGTTS
jgi:hypothetical protein